MVLEACDAGQVEQLEADRFEQPLLAAVPEIALLDDGAEIQLAPTDVVLVAVVVAGLEVVSAIEVELPHVLAHGVPPHAAAGAKANVVVHHAVVHQRSMPQVIAARVAAGARGIGNVLRVDVRLPRRDQVVRRHRVQQFRLYVTGASARLHVCPVQAGTSS